MSRKGDESKKLTGGSATLRPNYDAIQFEEDALPAEDSGDGPAYNALPSEPPTVVVHPGPMSLTPISHSTSSPLPTEEKKAAKLKPAAGVVTLRIDFVLFIHGIQAMVDDLKRQRTEAEAAASRETALAIQEESTCGGRTKKYVKDRPFMFGAIIPSAVFFLAVGLIIQSLMKKTPSPVDVGQPTQIALSELNNANNELWTYIDGQYLAGMVAGFTLGLIACFYVFDRYDKFYNRMPRDRLEAIQDSKLLTAERRLGQIEAALGSLAQALHDASSLSGSESSDGDGHSTTAATSPVDSRMLSVPISVKAAEEGKKRIRKTGAGSAIIDIRTGSSPALFSSSASSSTTTSSSSSTSFSVD